MFTTKSMERGVEKPQDMHRTHHDWDGDRSLSVTIIEAVADVSDTDPSNLPPLYDSINPDALDSLFTSQTVGKVSFEFAGVPVTVYATGEVLLRSR